MKKLIVAAFVAALVVAAAGPAAAGYPGRNGRVAFSRGEQIGTMKKDGTGLRTLTHLGPGAGAEAPQYSANGRWIVFDAVPPGESEFELYKVMYDGTHLRRLTHNAIYDWSPSWSPSGKYIVWSRDTNDIWVMRADGTHRRGLTTGCGCEWPRYSPDGSKIVFTDGDSIFVMNRDGSHRRTLAADAGSQDGYPEWSPSGKRIGFTSNRSGSSEVWAMRADGTHLVQLTTGFGSHYSPAWSPDGTAMIVSDGTTIYRLNLATRGLKPLQPESGYGTSWQPLV